MWPWRRRRAEVQRSTEDAVAPATAASPDSVAAPLTPAPAPAPTPPPAWRSLPAIQRTTADEPRINPPGDLTVSLASWRNPSFLGTLGHAVGAGEPAGVLHGLATPLVMPPEPSAAPSAGRPEPVTDAATAPLAIPPSAPVQRNVGQARHAPVPVQPLSVSRLTSAPPVPPLSIDLPVVPAPAPVVPSAPDVAADFAGAGAPDPGTPSASYPVQRAIDGGDAPAVPDSAGPVAPAPHPADGRPSAAAEADVAASESGTAPTLGADPTGGLALAQGPVADPAEPAATGTVPAVDPGEGGHPLVVSRSVADPGGGLPGRTSPLVGSSGEVSTGSPPDAPSTGSDFPAPFGVDPSGLTSVGGLSGPGGTDLPVQRAVASAPTPTRPDRPRRLGLGEPIVPPVLPLAGATGPTGSDAGISVSRYAVPGAPPPRSSPAPPSPASPSPQPAGPPSPSPASPGPASAAAPPATALAGDGGTPDSGMPGGNAAGNETDSTSGDTDAGAPPSAVTAGLLGEPITVSRLADGAATEHRAGPPGSGPARTGPTPDGVPFDAPLVSAVGNAGSAQAAPFPAAATQGADPDTVSLQAVRPEMAPTLGAVDLPLAAATDAPSLGSFSGTAGAATGGTQPLDTGLGSGTASAFDAGSGQNAGPVSGAGSAGPAALSTSTPTPPPLVVARLIGDRPVELLPRADNRGPSRFLPEPLPPSVQRVRWESSDVPDPRSADAYATGPGTGSGGTGATWTGAGGTGSGGTGSGSGAPGEVPGSVSPGGSFASAGPASTGPASVGTSVQRFGAPATPHRPVDLPSMGSPVASGMPVLLDPPSSPGGLPSTGPAVPPSAGAGGPGPALPVLREVSWLGTTGHAATASTGLAVVQRVEEAVPPHEPPPPPPPSPPSDLNEPAEPLPEAAPTPSSAGPGAAGPAAAPGAAAATDPEELLKKLFDPLLRRIKTELRLDRERQGLSGGPG